MISFLGGSPAFKLVCTLRTGSKFPSQLNVMTDKGYFQTQVGGLANA